MPSDTVFTVLKRCSTSLKNLQTLPPPLPNDQGVSGQRGVPTVVQLASCLPAELILKWFPSYTVEILPDGCIFSANDRSPLFGVLARANAICRMTIASRISFEIKIGCSGLLRMQLLRA